MKITKPTPGAVAWVDLSSPDVAASARFYAEIFGWEARDSGPEHGGYTTFHLGDDPVAAVGPLMSEGQPTAWSIYFGTDDSEATTAKIEAAGGKVLMAPFDVGAEGRMALYLDTEGTAFATWQGMNMPGIGVVDEPVSLTWVELMCRDPEAAKQFYGAAFGWSTEDDEINGEPYTRWELEGEERSVGGLVPMAGEMWPADLPSHWMLCFEVADCDATCEQITVLGGTVSVPPSTIPPGRFAVCGDPHGAFFSIIASTPRS